MKCGGGDPEGRVRHGNLLWQNSLVSVWRTALQAIDRAGLGGTEGEPLLGSILQVDEELLAAAAGDAVKVIALVDFDLVGKLADQLFLVAAGAPDGDVGFGLDAFAEVEHGDVFQDFLDGGGVDESDD